MKHFTLIILFLSAFNILGFAQDTLQILQRYHRNDTAYLEQYKAENKQKYFPLVQSTYGVGIWTELNPKVPRVDYIGIDFVNPDTGWAVGLYGAVIKTTNGGNNWETVQTPTGEILTKVHSYNGQVVIVVGHNGTILRSEDEGNTFTLLSGITTQELWGVKMLNDTLGWICGRNQTLLKTTDAGLTWQNISTGYNYHYWSFDFLNNDNFIIACNFGKILKTTNGGFNWTIYQAGNLDDLFTIDIIDSLHIGASGSYGKNVYSSDGGVNWIEHQFTSQPMNWIQYINEDTGYVILESFGLHKTTNRGQDWFEPGFNDAGDWQFELLNNTLSFAVGAALTVTKTEDGFITGRDLLLNKNWSDVYFINNSKGFLSSFDFQTKLYRTTDSGNSFQIVENSPIRNNDILFINSLTGFLGGYDAIYKTTDGGLDWYQAFISGSAGKIIFINDTIGWAVGGRNIYSTSNNGETWQINFSHPFSNFNGISFTDNNYGWVSGGRPQKTTNGGESWIEQNNTELWFSDDVYFISQDTGWIAKYTTISNSLFKTSDGGNSWIGIPEVVGARKLRFTQDPNHWLIIGFERYYMTYDNGTTWFEFTNEVPTGLTSFFMPTNNLGYAVGMLGLVLKFEDTTYVTVELTSFTSSVRENDITLNWQTATETNNYGFEIERNTPLNPLSRGEAEGRGVWRSIGFVNGNGTTTEPQSYSFLDKELSVGKYQYRLKQIDFDGTFEYSNTIEVEIGNPTKFSLEQNYPNPFNPSTKIRYQILQDGIVTLKIYNILGSEVATLVNEEKVAGKYEVNFNSSSLASGVYIYKIHSGSFIKSKKMILIK